MTTIITTDDNSSQIPPEPVPVVDNSAAIEIVSDDVEQVETEVDSLRDNTANAIEELGDRICDLEEVVAYIVANLDDVVEYLEQVHAEREAVNAETEPDTPVPEKPSKKIREHKEVEPKPRHPGRTFMLSRSGGIYP